MTKTFCDRCGAEIPDDLVYDVCIDFPIKSFSLGDPSGRKYQICGNCAKDMDSFMESEAAKDGA